MPDVPDLAALREKAEKATPGPWWAERDYLAAMIPGRRPNGEIIGQMRPSIRDLFTDEQRSATAEYVAAVSPDVLLAVLSLVDDLRAENERLREALKLAAVDLAIIDHMFGGGKTFERILTAIGEALAGSPAANKEQPPR